MREFSINDLENLSGVKKHTIRIWEQRYELLAPDRTETNIRLYSGKDLKCLLNIALLLKMGYRIGKIAKMEDAEINQILEGGIDVDSDLKFSLNSLKLAMLSYNEQLFTKTVDAHTEKHGFKSTFVDLLSPFLTQIGMLWRTSSVCPAQEHFVSNLVRQKICGKIDALPFVQPQDGKSYVLYLPESEIHDLTILMLHYLLKSKGMHSIFLGQSVPFEDLSQVVSRLDEVVFVSIFTTSPASSEVASYLDKVVKTFGPSTTKFHLSGYLLNDVANPDEGLINIHKDTQALLSALVG